MTFNLKTRLLLLTNQAQTEIKTIRQSGATWEETCFCQQRDMIKKNWDLTVSDAILQDDEDDADDDDDCW